VRITDLARARIHLRRTTLFLILASSIAVFLGERAFDNYLNLKAENKELSARKAETEKVIAENKGRMDSLLNTIRRQDKDIRYLSSQGESFKRRQFSLEMAKQIYEHIRREDPAMPVWKTSVRDIQQYILACRDFEGVYEKRHPKFAGKYSWKAMAKILYIEYGFRRDPPRGKADELGAPQIREFYTDSNGKKTLYLYNLLVRLGHKGKTYDKTISLYRESPRIQVECMYEHFTRKLKDQDGNFIRSVVAYNSIRALPEESAYWLKYQAITPKFNTWVERATQETEN